MMLPSHLDLRALSVDYAGHAGLHHAVRSLSLSLGQGQIGCLLGPSGCGKTTVLRAIAGFEPLAAGAILIANRTVADASCHLRPEQRRVGMMFQDYALFPHLDAAANIAFGLRHLKDADRKRRVSAMLDLVGLPGCGRMHPHALSGGQQQRVALARALAPEPDLLLLDEPFSNLDAGTRHQLASEMRDLLKAANTTVLMVTHDQIEAFAIADLVGVMSSGRLAQWGTSEDLYHHPENAFVGRFIGRGAVVAASTVGLPMEGQVLVRPEHLAPDADGSIHAVVVSRQFRGPDFSYRLRVADGGMLDIDLDASHGIRVGDRIRLRLCKPGIRTIADTADIADLADPPVGT